MMRSFHSLSRSERRLAAIAAACVVAAIALLAYRAASDRLALMDATIDRLQQDLLVYEELVAQSEQVNEAFAAMASQHSSQWTQEEIHDRLRREIARLSLRNVPPPGSPLPSVSNAGDVLVSIPQMPIGALLDREDGYRSYQINFKTEPASIQNITLFIERLQRSEQALRIDSLDIVRQPVANVATANMRVTRTVIDDVDGPATPDETAPAPQASEVLLRNPGFEECDRATGIFASWTADQCQVKRNGAQATEGLQCAEIRGTALPGSVYQTIEVTAGQSYHLVFDAYAWGNARVEVVDDATGQPYPGAQTLDSDGAPNRYHVQFAVPGEPGSVHVLRVPHIVVEGPETMVILDNCKLSEAPAE